MPFYALVQPPDVLPLVPEEPRKETPLLRLSKRFPQLRNGYVKNMLGLDHRPPRNVHANWQRLDSVRWLEHVKTGELVPVVGEIKEFIKTPRAQQEDMRFDERSLAQHLSLDGKINGSGHVMTEYKGWRKVELDNARAASLLNICTCPEDCSRVLPPELTPFFRQSSRRDPAVAIDKACACPCLPAIACVADSHARAHRYARHTHRRAPRTMHMHVRPRLPPTSRLPPTAHLRTRLAGARHRGPSAR